MVSVGAPRVQPAERRRRSLRGAFSARLEEAPGWVVYVTVVAVQALILVPLAMTHVLDTDEGMYALAAKLVAHGRVPYEDFWFQYTPLYTYAYGLWSRVAGESWYSLRMLSALLAILIGVLLYRHVSERLASRSFGLLAVLLCERGPSLPMEYDRSRRTRCRPCSCSSRTSSLPAPTA